MAGNGAVVLAHGVGELVVGGDVFEDVVEAGVAFVEYDGFLTGAFVVAEESLVEAAALVGGHGCIAFEEHFGHPALVADAGKGVEESVVGNGYVFNGVALGLEDGGHCLSDVHGGVS